MLLRRFFLLFIMASFSLGLSAKAKFDRHYSENFDDFSIELLLSGFGPSWGITYLPGHQLLLTQWKSGKIYLADLQTSELHLLAQIDDVYSAGQGGLMAVLADRNFSKNKRIYFTRSFLRGGESTTQLLSAVIKSVNEDEQEKPKFRFWRKDVGPYKLTAPQLLFSAEPWLDSRKHYGAALTQDDAGVLYLSIGDRGERQHAQDSQSQLGKIIRLELFSQLNGSVSLKQASIYSMGHRNPQGLIYVADIAELWSAEHGPRGGDEVNRIIEGGNYGWPLLTKGREYTGGKIAVAEHIDGMVDPMIAYVPSIATSALVYYANVENGAFFMPALDKHFLLLSLKAKQIHLLHTEGQRLVSKGLLLENIHERWRNAVVAPTGEVFLLAESGKVYRLYNSKNKQ